MSLFPIFLTLRTEGDVELVLRLQRRDPQALADLYDRYGRLVYSLILRVVRDTGVAEDLVQETFLRVWNRAQGFDAEKGSVGPWLDRKSTRLNSSHMSISYAVFCLKKKNQLNSPRPRQCSDSGS